MTTLSDADVIAVDASAEMLERIRVKALDLGLAPRVRTVQADVDHGWPVLEPLDPAGRRGSRYPEHAARR